MATAKKTGTPTSRAARRELAKIEEKSTRLKLQLAAHDERSAQLQQIIEQDEGAL